MAKRDNFPALLRSGKIKEERGKHVCLLPALIDGTEPAWLLTPASPAGEDRCSSKRLTPKSLH